MGGVPKRGGELPSDSRSADERFDSEGPGSDDCGSARPGRGEAAEDEAAVWAGVGIWRTVGVPVGREGMGDDNLAVELARMGWLSAGELWRDPRPGDDDDDDDAAAGGFADSAGSAAMLCCVWACGRGCGVGEVGLAEALGSLICV